MQVNVDKCECMHFSLDPKEAKWKPNLMFKSQNILVNPHPKFLGIKFDRTLSFKAHTKSLIKKLTKRLNVLRSLAGRDWGMSKEDLRTVFTTFISSAIEYCGTAYLPSMQKSVMNKLQVIQNTAARIITGCCRSTPIDLLNAEAGLTPITVKTDILAATAYDKSLRMPDDNPIKAPAEGKTKTRLKTQQSWRERGKALHAKTRLVDHSKEKQVNIGLVPPWTVRRNVTISDQLTSQTSRRDPKVKRNKIANDTINSLPAPDVQIWTDGSAKNGNEDGGSGVLIFGKEMGENYILAPAGKLTSSYRAEQIAVETGLKWMQLNIEFV